MTPAGERRTIGPSADFDVEEAISETHVLIVALSLVEYDPVTKISCHVQDLPADLILVRRDI